MVVSPCPVIVSGGDDETVRVWDANGTEVSVVRISSPVNALAFAGPRTVVGAAVRGLTLLQFEAHASARSAEHGV